MTVTTAPADTPIVRLFSASRRVLDCFAILLSPQERTLPLLGARSEIALPGLFEQVLRCAPGKGGDSQCRILVRVGGKTSPVGDEQVFDIVCLAESIQR